MISLTRKSSRSSAPGPAEYFTGTVSLETLVDTADPARVFAVNVTFEPGARTAWHTHPLGQTLIVTQGSGWVQHWDGPAQEIAVGDVVWIPPGVKHWHGASASSAMTHIAIAEKLNGKTADWMEQVSDAQYPA